VATLPGSARYARFFKAATFGLINFTQQDQEEMVAFMKLLD
jgi:hypothetical protein